MELKPYNHFCFVENSDLKTVIVANTDISPDTGKCTIFKSVAPQFSKTLKSEALGETDSTPLWFSSINGYMNHYCMLHQKQGSQFLSIGSIDTMELNDSVSFNEKLFRRVYANDEKDKVALIGKDRLCCFNLTKGKPICSKEVKDVSCGVYKDNVFHLFKKNSLVLVDTREEHLQENIIYEGLDCPIVNDAVIDLSNPNSVIFVGCDGDIGSIDTSVNAMHKLHKSTFGHRINSVGLSIDYDHFHQRHLIAYREIERVDPNDDSSCSCLSIFHTRAHHTYIKAEVRRAHFCPDNIPMFAYYIRGQTLQLDILKS